MNMLLSADRFTTILLVVMVVGMVRWERRIYGTYLSPILLIAAPYAFLVVLINFVAVYFGYFTVSSKANLLVMLFFGLFFLVGLLIRKMFLPPIQVTNGDLSDIKSDADENEIYYRILAIVTLIAGVVQFRGAIGQVGLANIGSLEFKELYGGGIFGHIMLASRPAFFFLFASLMRRRSKVNLLLLFGIFVMVVLPQVKYQIVTLLVASIIFSINLGVIKVTVRKLLVSVVLIYLLFNITYVIGFSASGLDFAYSDKIQAFLFNHFFTYLFGGPIGFSEVLKMQQYPYLSVIELLAVPANIYKAIIGDSQYVQIIIQQWFPISTITKYFHGTNTFGLFGMLYAYVGIVGAGLFTMLYAVISYIIFQFYLLKIKSLAFRMASAFIGAYLVLSFFGLYFNMLPFYEVLVYTLVIPSMIHILKGINKLKFRISVATDVGEMNVINVARKPESSE